MNKSAEQILVALYSQMGYDGHGWWLKEIWLGEGDDPLSYEEFYKKLESSLFDCGECMTQQEEYESLLSTMNWWYDRSKDYSIYSKGKRQWERICQLMKVIDKDQLIYKSYLKEKL